MNNIKLSLALFAPLPVIGVLTGVVAGWWGVIRADGVQAVTNESAPLYIALAFLLPIAHFATIYISKNLVEYQEIYRSLPKTLIVLIAIAFLGAVVATGLFIVATFQISAVFGGEAPVSLMQALQPAVFANAPLVISITMITGVISGIWANHAVASLPD